MLVLILTRFLLARMHIDLLATRSILGTLEWTLKNLPEGLKELDKAYDDVITRIQTQDEEEVALAQDTLTWLYYAIRPLTLQELRHALATKLAAEVDPEATKLNEDFVPDEEVIISVCAGIVALHHDSNTIAFVHYTTKEYFKRRFERQDVETFLRHEKTVAETCLVYLSFERDEFEQFLAERAEQRGLWYTFHSYAREQCPEWDIDVLYPLFRYAARHWGDHAHGRLEQTTKAQIIKFVRQRTAVAASVQVVAEQEYDHECFPILMSGLCLVSFFGLEELAVTLLEAGDDVAAKDEDDWTALHMAAERGHAAVVQLLLDAGACINAATDIPGNGSSGATARTAWHESHTRYSCRPAPARTYSPAEWPRWKWRTSPTASRVSRLR